LFDRTLSGRGFFVFKIIFLSLTVPS